MSAPAAEIGPLAASAITFAFTICALSSVITDSSAAGTKISHAKPAQSPLSLSVTVPGNPRIVPFAFL